MTGPTNWKPRFLMAFEIVSDRGVLAGVVLPSPTTTRSLITGLPSGRHHDKTGAWEMHTDLSDRGIAASDDDLMDARGGQLADDRIASGIIRRDGHCLTRFPADRISRIGITLAIDVASLAASSAFFEVVGLRLPWPIAAMRSVQLSSLGKPSSGTAAGPKFCFKNQIGW